MAIYLELCSKPLKHLFYILRNDAFEIQLQIKFKLSFKIDLSNTQIKSREVVTEIR